MEVWAGMSFHTVSVQAVQRDLEVSREAEGEGVQS